MPDRNVLESDATESAVLCDRRRSVRDAGWPRGGSRRAADRWLRGLGQRHRGHRRSLWRREPSVVASSANTEREEIRVYRARERPGHAGQRRHAAARARDRAMAGGIAQHKRRWWSTTCKLESMRLPGWAWLALSSLLFQALWREQSRPHYGGTLTVELSTPWTTLDPGGIQTAVDSDRRNIGARRLPRRRLSQCWPWLGNTIRISSAGDFHCVRKSPSTMAKRSPAPAPRHRCWRH